MGKAGFGPYRLFDVNGMESKDGTSTLNRTEVQTVLFLLEKLSSAGEDLRTGVAVITGYRAQVTAIRRGVKDKFGDSIATSVEVGTVDAFQGREKDVVIFSCVRSGSNVGFLGSIRRCNVALTRARVALYIVGEYVPETMQAGCWRPSWPWPSRGTGPAPPPSTSQAPDCDIGGLCFAQAGLQPWRRMRCGTISSRTLARVV